MTTRGRRRVFHVFSDRVNIGDYLAALGIREALGAQHEYIDCELISPDTMPDTLSLLDEATEEDLVVVGGGGLLHRCFSAVWERLAEQPPRADVHVWGVGVIKSKTENLSAPSDLVLSGLVNASSVCVRDMATQQYLNSPFPVLDCPATVALNNRLGQPRAGGYLLHVMHEDLVGPLVHEHAAQLQELAAQIGLGYRQFDNLIPGATAAELEDALNLYRDSDLVVSSRLHGCITAAAFDKPVIALSNDFKIDEFMTGIGLGAWCLPISDPDALREAVLAAQGQSRDAWLPQAVRRNSDWARGVLGDDEWISDTHEFAVMSPRRAKPGRRARLAVVVGCGRSGTHWFGHFLNSHPDITVSFEDPDTFPLITQMALDPTTRTDLMPQLLDAYADKLRTADTPWFVDKSHPALWMTEDIASRFPDVVFLGVQRDPFETVASMIRHEFVSAWPSRWREFPVPNDFLGIAEQDVAGYDTYSLPHKHALRWRSHATRMTELVQAGTVHKVDYATLRDEPAVVSEVVATALSVDMQFQTVAMDRGDSPQWWDVLSDQDVRQIEQVTGLKSPARLAPRRRGMLRRWLLGRRFLSR